MAMSAGCRSFHLNFEGAWSIFKFRVGQIFLSIHTPYGHSTVTWTRARAFEDLLKAMSSMAEYGDGPRHKFVVGVHNPDVPNPWDYALNHDFDFACILISRPQLQSEILSLPPISPQLNQVLFKNALLRPSGKCSRYMIMLTRGPRPAHARDCFIMA
jgi:hypothetical protein